jgi:hypothetical protein
MEREVERRMRRVAAVGVACAGALFASCSSSSTPGFDGADGSAPDDASVPPGDDGAVQVASDSGGTFVAGPTCKAGTYMGTFTCEYQLFDSNSEAGTEAGAEGGLGISVSGSLTLVLAQEVTGGESFLPVSSGSVSGVADKSYMFSAVMNGQLDCAQDTFTGELTMGSWTGPPGLFGPLAGTFTVSMAAGYDKGKSAFTSGLFGGGCIGTWSAMYSGPATVGSE